MKIIVAGDYCEHNRAGDYITKGNYGYIFDDVKDIIALSDLRIVNFEFPLFSKNSKPIKKNGPCLKGCDNNVQAIKYAGFNLCTLANNHILDQGELCCLETQIKINAAGISTVGVGNNLKDAAAIYYKEIDNEIVAIINCCEHEFSVATAKSAGANPLDVIQQYYQIKKAREKANYVIVIVHGGHEMVQLPSPRMKEIYHFFIDVGADVVVNHHQHCYSGYEIYNEKPIFYGLGNLYFDWNGKRKSIWNEGFMVELCLEKNSSIHFKLYPYIQCDDEPRIIRLSDERMIEFNKEIDDLNSIIKDDKMLVEKYEGIMKNNPNGYKKIFEPYNNKLLNSLYYRGVLPSFITEEKKLQILNYIDCESHLDKLRIIIRNINS